MNNRKHTFLFPLSFSPASKTGRRSTVDYFPRMVALARQVINFTSIWFYTPLLTSLILLISWYFMIQEFHNGHIQSGKIIRFLVFSIAFLLDKGIFCFVVRVQPSMDFGFYLTIVTSTVLFYLLLPLLIVFFVKFCQNGVITIKAATEFLYAVFVLSGMEIAYGLGNSSPAGVLLGIIRFFFVRFQDSMIPDRTLPKRKRKGEIKGERKGEIKKEKEKVE
jgi:hypothetical protein